MAPGYLEKDVPCSYVWEGAPTSSPVISFEMLREEPDLLNRHLLMYDEPWVSFFWHGQSANRCETFITAR